jgi:hypothetical protein
MKSYTDLEQSKKLAEFLPLESADMWWAERYAGQVMANGQYIVDEKPVYYLSLTKPSNDNYSKDTVKDIPCWSLAALLDILPLGTELLKFEHSYHCQSDMCDTWALNPIDACVEMIEKLHKQMIYDFNNG